MGKVLSLAVAAFTVALLPSGSYADTLPVVDLGFSVTQAILNVSQ